MIEQATEPQIQEEIERLRATFPNTQDLYREACVLLFFRFGITPTANKLYQFVRKGSMSAPTEALSKFWENLRLKSRVRIENPDLPDDVRDAAGNLVAALWTKSQEAAQASLEALRAQSEDEVRSAKDAQVQAQDEALELNDKLGQARLLVGQKVQSIQRLQADLAGERAARSGLEDQLAQAQSENAKLHQALADSRRDFALEIERIRGAAELAEERQKGSEARALIEIDRERSATARIQKELASIRQLALEAEERNRVELTRLQTELGQTLLRLGSVDGALQEIQAARAEMAAELQAIRTSSSQTANMLAIAQRDSEIAHAQIKSLDGEIATLRSSLAEAKLVAARASLNPVKVRRKRTGPATGNP